LSSTTQFAENTALWHIRIAIKFPWEIPASCNSCSVSALVYVYCLHVYKGEMHLCERSAAESSLSVIIDCALTVVERCIYVALFLGFSVICNICNAVNHLCSLAVFCSKCNDW